MNSKFNIIVIVYISISFFLYKEYKVSTLFLGSFDKMNQHFIPLLPLLKHT